MNVAGVLQTGGWEWAMRYFGGVLGGVLGGIWGGFLGRVLALVRLMAGCRGGAVHGENGTAAGGSGRPD